MNRKLNLSATLNSEQKKSLNMILILNVIIERAEIIKRVIQYQRLGQRCFCHSYFSKLYIFFSLLILRGDFWRHKYIFEAFVFTCNNSLGWSLYVTGSAKIKRFK